MKPIAFALAAVLALSATPAFAQDSGQPSAPGATNRTGNPSDSGIIATTPSRIPGTRREMNRGFSDRGGVAGMTARQTRRYAADLVRRAAIECDVDDAKLAALAEDNVPVFEVSCGAGYGFMIVDTDPIQASDCLVIQPSDEELAQDSTLVACQLPANVASIAAARQSARN